MPSQSRVCLLRLAGYWLPITCTLAYAPSTAAQTESPLVADTTVSHVAAAQKVSFGRADSTMTLDGRLDESAWSSVSAVTQFFEIYPANVGSPSVETEARFLYDSKNIYIGIRAHDSGAVAIRSSLVSRDQIPADQDYIEILLDPFNGHHDAFMFRVNALGAISDGQFNDTTQVRDFAPDFNFDVKTSIDSGGWAAEFRIPLSTLRYKAGGAQTWGFVLNRNLPRRITTALSSAPISRGSNCTLCLSGQVSGISLETVRAPFYMTPQVTYSRNESSSGGEAKQATDEKSIGFDAKWLPRPNAVVDLTVSPDFSQVPVDAPQFTANTLFTLALSEKRPFFLEGSDLLSTPINSVYTRSFVNPETGARLTQRGDDHDYTALFLRDAGGGSIIEPGSIFSGSGIEESKSTALIARRTQHGDNTTWGLLASGRHYDDGSGNWVVGTDATWSPSNADRIGVQFLWSHTQNPNRPADVATWLGQKFDGAAGILNWQHSADLWNSALSYSAYSHGFRAWNGFVTQVGISQFGGSVGLRLYPSSRGIVSISPGVAFSRSAEISGGELSRSLSPGITVEMPHGSSIALTWSPNAKSTTLVGLRSFDSFTVSLSTAPAPWIPVIAVSGSLGDGLDVTTGEVGKLISWQTSVLLRFWGHLDFATSTGYQSLSSRRPNNPPSSLFTERNDQIIATWYFSNRLYLQGTYQTSNLILPPQVNLLNVNSQSASNFSSLLLSYQHNWQTEYFVGFSRALGRSNDALVPTNEQTGIFAKFSYVFSM